jgi:hypothetical protein
MPRWLICHRSYDHQTHPGSLAKQGGKTSTFVPIERPYMFTAELPLPELALVVGTRGLLGGGLGLLLAERVKPDQRRAVGWTLIAIGVVTTIPLMLMVFNRRKRVPD